MAKNSEKEQFRLTLSKNLKRLSYFSKFEEFRERVHLNSEKEKKIFKLGKRVKSNIKEFGYISNFRSFDSSSNLL